MITGFACFISLPCAGMTACPTEFPFCSIVDCLSVYFAQILYFLKQADAKLYVYLTNACCDDSYLTFAVPLCI